MWKPLRIRELAIRTMAVEAKSLKAKVPTATPPCEEPNTSTQRAKNIFKEWMNMDVSAEDTIIVQLVFRYLVIWRISREKLRKEGTSKW